MASVPRRLGNPGSAGQHQLQGSTCASRQPRSPVGLSSNRILAGRRPLLCPDRVGGLVECDSPSDFEPATPDSPSDSSGFVATRLSPYGVEPARETSVIRA